MYQRNLHWGKLMILVLAAILVNVVWHVAHIVFLPIHLSFYDINRASLTNRIKSGQLSCSICRLVLHFLQLRLIILASIFQLLAVDHRFIVVLVSVHKIILVMPFLS